MNLKLIWRGSIDLKFMSRGFLADPTPHLKRRLDRYSRFCTARGYDQQADKQTTLQDGPKKLYIF